MIVIISNTIIQLLYMHQEIFSSKFSPFFYTVYYTIALLIRFQDSNDRYNTIVL